MIKNIKKYTPTELRISTMTVTSNFNTDINLSVVAKKLPIVNFYSNEIGCIKIEPAPPFTTRGQCKKDVENKKKKPKKVFYNQATIIVRILDNQQNKEVNFKLFSNGRIQMTGIKSIKLAEDTLKLMLSILLELYDIDDENNRIEAIENKTGIKYGKVNIHLINSDFTTGFKIKRDILHQLLVNEYNIYSTFEPCIYPGVNTKYYWNSSNIEDGVCNCSKTCVGKGTGCGDGDCKKVTISIFQSGAIIITGATNEKQLEDAYNFINKILNDNFEMLERIPPPEPIEENNFKLVKKKQKVYLKKDTIKTNNSILYHMDSNTHILK